MTWSHKEGLVLTYACHSWFKHIQMPVLRGEPSVPGEGGEMHASSLMGVSATAVLWFLWGPERVPFWWIRLLEEGWPPNGDKGSQLVPCTAGAQEEDASHGNCGHMAGGVPVWEQSARPL